MSLDGDRGTGDGGSGSDGGSTGDANGSADASQPDAAVDAPPAFPAVLDLHINCRNDCVLIANPASISVPAGTSFEVAAHRELERLVA